MNDIITLINGDIMLQFKKTQDDAKLPSKAHPNDSGYDLYALERTTVSVDGVTTIRTGICMGIPNGVWVKIEAKSGLATKKNLGVTAGIIDQGYRGEVMVAMVNYGSETHVFEKGDKVAQAVLYPLIPMETEEIKKFSTETQRGENGFGSSGR